MSEIMNMPLVYADFKNADPRGCLRLNCAGTTEDLSREGIELREGLRLMPHDEEVEANGIAHFSAEERVWVAIIDWQKVRRFARGFGG